MEPFATLADFKELYDTELDNKRLKALIQAASVTVARLLQKRGIDWESADDLYKEDLKNIVCAMVNRAQITCDDGPYTQMTDTVGPYTQSRTLANPDQSLYLTKEEKRRLGLLASNLGSIRVFIEGADNDTW